MPNNTPSIYEGMQWLFQGAGLEIMLRRQSMRATNCPRPTDDPTERNGDDGV